MRREGEGEGEDGRGGEGVPRRGFGHEDEEEAVGACKLLEGA